MSALPAPPLDQDPEEPRKPRRKQRLVWRVLEWTVGVIALLIVIAIVAVYGLLHSAKFHAYLLRTVQQKATASLGSDLRMRDFALHTPNLWNYSLDLYDVSIAGAEPYPNPPLLQVQHMNAGLHVTSLLHKTWYVDNIRVDHPVVHVYFDKTGKNNLPTPKKSSNSQSNTDLWSLGIRHALLDNGEVYYNNDKSVLSADLHDLTFQSTFVEAEKRYTGELSYRDGTLKTSTYNPIPHDLQARFDATPDKFTLHDATLHSGHSQFVLNADVIDYNDPKINAKYDAVVDAGEFRHILKNPSLPQGLLRAAGDLKYQSVPGKQFMEAVVLNGNLSSRALQVRTSAAGVTVNDIGAQYALANGDLSVRDMRARWLGGELTGTATMKAISGTNPSSGLQAQLRGMQLADAKPFLPPSTAQQIALGGTVNADADVRWGKTFDNAIAVANATMQANVAPAQSPGQRVPLNGVIHARYAMANKTLTLTNSSVTLPQTAVNLNGTVSDHSALRVQMHAGDLHQLETIASLFRTATPGTQPQALGLFGVADFNGSVSGSTAAPHVVGQFTAQNLRVHGTAWRVLRTNVDASPHQAALHNGLLQPADRGQITFDVGTTLSNWAFTKSSQFQTALNANNLNVGTLAKAAGMANAPAGTLSLNVNAHGTELNPIGQGSLRLVNASMSSQDLPNVNLTFNGTGDQVNGNLNARSPAGAANAVFTYFPKQQGYRVQLNADGIQLQKIKALTAKVPDLNGVLNLNASGQGTVKDPQLTASLQIPRLVAQKQTIEGIALNTTVANHVANFALDSQAVNTTIRGRGRVDLVGNYNSDITLDTQRIPLGPLVALYAPAQAGALTGATELHATVRGPLKDQTKIEAHATIPVLQVNYRNTVQIAAANPIRIDYVNGRADVQRAVIRGTDTDLTLQASVPLVNRNAPMSLLLQGTVDLGIAQLFAPDLRTSGQLRFDINSFGQTTNPNVQGQVRIVNAAFASGDLPVGLSNANGVLTLTKDRLDISSFQGTVGGGTVTAKGGVLYRPAIQFNMAAAMRDIRLMYPAGMREGVAGDVTLTGTMDAATLGGQIRLNDLSFTPDFDLTSFVGQFSAGGTAPPPTQSFADILRLNLNVFSPNGINLVSRTLSLNGNADLRVRGTASQPVILGRVNLNSGDLIFNSDRFTLQGGTIDFVDPNQTKPNLNVAVDTTVQQYDIHMRFNGPIDHMQTLYSSDPALPQADIINLIAFGKTTESSAANPNPGNSGAQSLIASGVASQVSSRLEKAAGISQLSIDPTLGGNGAQPGARVTVRQRVTGNLFVTFSTNVTNTQDQTIEGQYNLGRRLSVSGTRDQNGGFAFDALIHKRW
ncbi:MAG TPA: translocation/assembly module TamB domain-containing protein [Terriglobales bacterium]